MINNGRYIYCPFYIRGCDQRDQADGIHCSRLENADRMFSEARNQTRQDRQQLVEALLRANSQHFSLSSYQLEDQKLSAI